MLPKLIAQGDQSVEPITLAQAQLHLRLDLEAGQHPDDSLVSALITVARQDAENYTGLALTQQTFVAYYDEFPTDDLDLGIWPVRSITSVQYVDSDGNTQTFSSTAYRLDPNDKPAVLQYVDAWPQTKAQKNAVTVTFVAGYAAGSPTRWNLPKPIYQAMLMMIGHLYENRESVNVGNMVTAYPLGMMHLLTPYRLKMGV